MDTIIILHGIQFKNDDYCLSKSIFKVFKHTHLVLDIQQPCNCFVFMLQNITYADQGSVCLSNQSIIDGLTQECMTIDSYCSPVGSSTVSLSPSNDDGKWKTILAIVIPSTVIVIILSLIGIYIFQKRQQNKSDTNVVMKDGIVNMFAKK
ncbi:unnamed protein product [Adineta ricciae]|uniref:Uncharacterized protein n=2 Tax=Adineta ricciae TaxID=249248 RepID=A0A815BIP6_ADIRI|nr:unnamed protein product [Adineta ricciae]